MNIEHLVVRAGDDALATGVVIRTHTGHAVMESDSAEMISDVLPAPGLSGTAADADAPTHVPVTGPSVDPGVWDRLLGRTVTAHGVWDGRQLRVRTITGPQRPAPGPVSARERAPQTTSTRLPTVEAAERKLRSDPSILWHTHVQRDDGTAQLLVTTYDVAYAERVLRPSYGEDLVIVQCPWTAETDSLVNNASDVADDEGILHSIGQTAGADHLVRWTMGVRQMTAALAVALENVHSDALLLRTLLEPAPGRSPEPSGAPASRDG